MVHFWGGLGGSKMRAATEKKVKKKVTRKKKYGKKSEVNKKKYRKKVRRGPIGV